MQNRIKNRKPYSKPRWPFRFCPTLSYWKDWWAHQGSNVISGAVARIRFNTTGW